MDRVPKCVLGASEHFVYQFNYCKIDVEMPAAPDQLQKGKKCLLEL